MVVTHKVVMQHNYTSNMSESIIYCVDKFSINVDWCNMEESINVLCIEGCNVTCCYKVVYLDQKCALFSIYIIISLYAVVGFFWINHAVSKTQLLIRLYKCIQQKLICITSRLTSCYVCRCICDSCFCPEAVYLSHGCTYKATNEV